jgi:release factor glutamine methyltransferase
VEAFDAVLANPPYLSSAELAQAPAEVRDFEPTEALAAPDGGCADLEEIIRQAPRYLRRGGLLALETGIGQHARLLEGLRAAGFSQAESRRDLAQRERFILAVW